MSAEVMERIVEELVALRRRVAELEIREVPGQFQGVIAPGVAYGCAPTLYCAFDGKTPFEQDFTGNLYGHEGQPPTIGGGVICRPGKYGKGCQIAEAATNLIVNPSAEVNAADGNGFWNQGTSTVTWTRDTTQSLYGAACYKGVYNYINGVCQRYFMRMDGTRFPYGGSVAYTFSVWIYIASYTAGAKVGVVCDEYSSGSGYLQSAISFLTIGAGDVGRWQRLTCGRTSHANCATVLPIVWFTDASCTVYVDGCQLEQTAQATPYLDGTMGAGHSWSGTAHQSTSSRTAAYLQYDIKWIRADKGTVAMWVKPACGNPNNSFVFAAGNVNAALDAYLGTAVGWVHFRYAGSTISANGLAAETWTHLAFVWDQPAAIWKIYLNGAEAATGTPGAVPALASYLGIGCSAPVGTAFAPNAVLDDWVVFDRALSAGEVKAIYTSNAPLHTDTGGLAGYNGYYVGCKQGLRRIEVKSSATARGGAGIYTESVTWDNAFNTISEAIGWQYGSGSLAFDARGGSISTTGASHTGYINGACTTTVRFIGVGT
jgi:hypothetical protein